MASIIRQFALLAWKNWLLTKRRPVVTIFELLMPLIMPGVMLLLRPFVSATVADSPTHYPPFSVDQLPAHLLPPLMRHPDVPTPPEFGGRRNIWLVAYTPNNTVVSTLMRLAMATFNPSPDSNVTDVPYYAPRGKTANVV